MISVTSQLGVPQCGSGLLQHSAVTKGLDHKFCYGNLPKPPYCDSTAMTRIGYARVSTTDQNLDIQVTQLKAVGCEVVRSETGSGGSRQGRSELATIMDFLSEGDELVVLRLDRLGRSTRDVLNLVHDLDARGATLRVLEPEVTTAGDMGRMVITVLGMVADMELKIHQG